LGVIWVKQSVFDTVYNSQRTDGWRIARMVKKYIWSARQVNVIGLLAIVAGGDTSGVE